MLSFYFTVIYFETHCIFGRWFSEECPDCRLFHDAEILDRESCTGTRSNGVETSWLAAGWPVDTKRYVTQVPNDISGRREDDLSPVPSLPQSLFPDPSSFSPTFFRGNRANHRSLFRTIFLISRLDENFIFSLPTDLFVQYKLLCLQHIIW